MLRLKEVSMGYELGKFAHLSKYMDKTNLSENLNILDDKKFNSNKSGKWEKQEYHYVKIKRQSLVYKEINRTSRNLIILNFFIVFFTAWFLVQNSYTDGEYVGFIISLSLLLLGFFNVKKGLESIADISTSKPYKQLEKFGDPELLIQNIENEINGEIFLINKNSKLTKSWIIYSGFLWLDFTKLDRAAWVYKKVTKHYRNFIPVGKTYEIIINTINGTTSLNIKSQRGDELITELSSLAPWIVLGYSDERNRIWLKDKARFLNAVDERKSIKI
jgi:hypothetical protein